MINMNYKKFIKDQEMRFKILHLLRFIPDKVMIKLQYLIKLGRLPNLKEPVRFTEKLQWYKLYYRNSKMTQSADKYEVRNYVKSKGLGYILNQLYAVYDNVDQIQLRDLPNKFVMKTTNGSGTNYFCTDKTNFPITEVKQSMKDWINRDIFSSGREWSYKDIKPRVIVEEMLESKDNKYSGINDYKFLCFNGDVKYIVVDVDRHVDHRRNIYDTKWNKIDVSTDYPNFENTMKKPGKLDEMLKIAKAFAEDFPFVRVDLYLVDNVIYFGELTFYPWTGYVKFDPDEFDYILGKQLKLQ